MTTNEYYDKNNIKIKEGMTIEHIHGDKELVHSNAKGDDLGIDATSKNILSSHEIYLLGGFDLSEWTIVDTLTKDS